MVILVPLPKTLVWEKVCGKPTDRVDGDVLLHSILIFCEVGMPVRGACDYTFL